MLPLANAQTNFNLNLLSTYDYQEDCNDIWGYVAPDGTEYAIMGTRLATAIISLADPSNPIEVAYIPGANSLWRDMKSWGEYVYVTADEGDDGLLMVNMSGAPDNITWEFWHPILNVGNVNDHLSRCHNIFIDENGYAYLSGCETGNANDEVDQGTPLNGRGVLILDVHTTPGSPIFVGMGASVYSHDSFVRGDTLWSSDITEGYFSVQDVSDKSNVSTWATQGTTLDFTHNAWLSDDGNYLFTTDEKPNAYVDSYDVSDLSDIKYLDSFRPTATAGNDVIPHNTHYKDGYLITSWYTDGVVITDVHRPENMIKIGGYDTFSGAHGGFYGCWGAYPWLPSGLVLASDIQSGLHVFQPTYERACYLEGTVTEEGTGNALNAVTVELVANDAPEKSTDFNGEYKSGYATAGTYSVNFSKLGYWPKTVEVTLVNGEITILDVELDKVDEFNFTVNVFDAITGNPIPSSSVVLEGIQPEQFSTDASGSGSVILFENTLGAYTIYAGKWGYLHESMSTTIDLSTNSIDVMLNPGYQDDFIFDLGWTTVGTASRGDWERGVPIPTTFDGDNSNVNADMPNDLGNECYMTGNGGGSAGDDDVDNGQVYLISPSMDLTTYANPVITYRTWFFNDGGGQGSGNPNDQLSVTIENGMEQVTLEVIDNSQSFWRPQSEFVVADYITITDNMNVTFQTGDLSNSGHLVEAGVDVFFVDGLVATKDIDATAFKVGVFPNPFSESLTVTYQLEENFTNTKLVIFNTIGQQIAERNIDALEGSIELGAEMNAGLYFLQFVSDEKRSEVRKVVKR